jgi:hypothetical protein
MQSFGLLQPKLSLVHVSAANGIFQPTQCDKTFVTADQLLHLRT